MPSVPTSFRRLMLLAMLVAGSGADIARAAAYPPVEHATYHQLIFADPDLGLLKNVYPPHSDSGFHEHHRELFYVVITPARFGAQRPGGPLTLPAKAVPAGTTGYNLMTAEPFIHRVVNDDERSCHIIAIEIRRAAPAGTAVSARPSAYAPIFDNPRLKAWRLVLAPGQSVAAVTQVGKGARVVVRGGTLVTSVAGLPDQALAIEPGDVAVQPVGLTRSLRNAGGTPIEIVEVELK